MDPSGKNPNCNNPYLNPRECNPPNTNNYNEKQEPESVSWVSNPFGDNASLYLAPIYDKNGQIKYRTNAAQFKIAGHEISCERVPDENGQIKCRPGSMYNQNFFGQVTISAIAYLFDRSVTARKIVEDMAEMGVDKSNPTGPGTLAYFVNKYYSKYLYAKTESSTNSELSDQLRNKIAAGYLIISGVNILNGGSIVGGRVNPSGHIGHWVMITGISREWDDSGVLELSPWNWVRIFNPFDNETEYYWWGDFSRAWWSPSSKYNMLLVKPYLSPGICRGSSC
jgi:hypothetical protein